MAGKTCRVSFRGADGIRHAVEVQAESVYEAAALGLKVLRRSDWIDVIGAGTRIDVEVHEPPVQHFLMYAQLMRWLEGAASSPAESLKRRKLKDMLAS